MSGDNTPFIRTTPADFGMGDVVWCERRKLLSVAWSRKREPSCEHTLPNQPDQPASMCRICKDGQKLADWRDYWTGIKRQAAQLRAEQES